MSEPGDTVDISEETSGLPPLNRTHPDEGVDHPSDGGESQVERGFVYTSNVNDAPVGDAGQCGPVRDPEGSSLSCQVDYGPQDDTVWLSRFVLEWDSCPGALPDDLDSLDPNAEVRPATDFNLALKTPGGDAFWMSTSFDDTSESFEFCHQEDGDYQVMVIPTVQDWGCTFPEDPSRKGERQVIIEERIRVPVDECPNLTNYGYRFENSEPTK